MMSDVSNVRQLRGRVQADVLIGTADNGGAVRVTVEVGVTDPEMKKAMTRVQNLLRQRALSQLAEAQRNRESWGK